MAAKYWVYCAGIGTRRRPRRQHPPRLLGPLTDGRKPGGFDAEGAAERMRQLDRLSGRVLGDRAIQHTDDEINELVRRASKAASVTYQSQRTTAAGPVEQGSIRARITKDSNRIFEFACATCRHAGHGPIVKTQAEIHTLIDEMREAGLSVYESSSGGRFVSRAALLSVLK